ncbi:MAG: DUF418 domain-containing protein [Pseudomonadota bacterium]
MSESVPAAGPVAVGDRIDYLDILRGFAVMAIFIVNIKAMVMPFAFYANSSLWATDLDQHIATIQKFVVDDKWRTTFTALYGAGLLMIWQRLEARGEGRGVLFRRTFWLLIFGAIHLLGLWTGDILFSYGLAGFLAILFVRMGTTKLYIFGLIILLLGTVWMAFFAAGPVYNDELRAELEPLFWAPGPEEIASEVASQQGSIMGQFEARIEGAIGYIGFFVIIGGGLMTTLGLMVLGMALFRSGLYRGVWPIALTFPLGLAALAGAWVLDWIQIQELKASNYSFDVYSLNAWKASLDGYLGALGYGCLISAIVSMGLKFGPVAAVGRMAFTNYITCTLIGTTLAVGHGGGLFGEVSLVFLMGVVVATFIGMLIWSPLWLRFFRFGPLEWLWRSLVYGRAQPLLR